MSNEKIRDWRGALVYNPLMSQDPKRPRTSPRDGQRASSQAVRATILKAALEAFSDRGFHAVSTRAIAAAAGIEQGHLVYYFPTKQVLWRETITSFNTNFERLLASCPAEWPDEAAVRSLGRDLLRRILTFFASHRALTRMMLQEFSTQSDRHDWLVGEFGRPAWAKLEPLFAVIAQRRARPTAPALLYFQFLGAALLFFGSSREAAQIAGPELASSEAAEMFIDLQLDTLLDLR